MLFNDDDAWDTAAKIYSQEFEEKEPFSPPIVSVSDVSEISPKRISQAADEDVLPSFGSIRASNQRERLSEVARWYLTYRKFAFPKHESRRRAEKRVSNEHGIRRQNLHVYYSRIADKNKSTPTEWFTDQLEEFWKWYSDRFDPLPEPSFRDSCRRLRNTLFDIQGTPTPALSPEDFTVGDFLDAGDERIVNNSDVLIQTDDPEQPYREKNIRLRENASVRFYDMTKYSVPWSKTWKNILEVIETHLTRWSKIDDAASLTNEWDCSEAYARWPPEKRKKGSYYDVQLPVRYHGNSYMDICADIWPPWLEETERITFSSIGTKYTDSAVNSFLVKALRKAERAAI